MLDLEQFKQKTFDVRLPDGQKLKLKKPSQKFALELAGMADLTESDTAETFSFLVEVVAKLLNHNTRGIPYTEEYVEEELTLEMCLALVNGYAAFMNELTNEKN